MKNMFASMYLLTSLDITNFDSSQVIDMSNKFPYNSLITNINLLNFIHQMLSLCKVYSIIVQI